jgi:UDP-glucuronate 4-epimerase
VELAPLQPGDVAETYADIAATTRELGFRPATRLDQGVPRFVDWYKEYAGAAQARRLSAE